MTIDFTALKPFTENSDYNSQERYTGAEQQFTGLFTIDCDVNKSFKTFLFELVLKCLQTEGEAPPLLLHKFSDDVININISFSVFINRQG